MVTSHRDCHNGLFGKPPALNRPSASGRLSTLLLCTISLIAVCGVLPVSVHAAPLPALEYIDCIGSTVNLTVKAARVTVDGVLSYTAPQYHNPSSTPHFPGPVLRMKAGTQCRVNIINELPDNTEPDGCPRHANAFHCGSSTNLHTHGLHVSPYQDDVSTNVEPGETLLYTYDVPESHLMGTHWYHSHVHGSTSLQVAGGLHSMLQLLPADSYTLPSDWSALYDQADFTYDMVFSHAMFSGSETVGAFGFRSYPDVVGVYPNSIVQPETDFVEGAPTNVYVVNGAYQPSISVAPGSAALVRMVHAGGARVLIMSLNDPSDLCTVTLLARDGVFQQSPYPTVTYMAFAAGTRADYAIVCSEAAAGQTITVSSSAASGEWGTVTPHVQTTVFSIVVDGTAPSPLVSVPTSETPFPTYLNDLQGETPVRDPTVINFAAGAVNGQAFPGFEAEQYLETFCLDSVYELQLGGGGGGGGGSGSGPPPGGPPPPPPGRRLASKESVTQKSKSSSSTAAVTSHTAFAHRPNLRRRLQAAGNDAHPYHQHVNHFQIVTIPNALHSPDFLRVGEWRDVLPANGASVRTLPVDYAGPQIMHCHWLQHEDIGMMALYSIDECPTPSPTPSPSPSPSAGPSPSPSPSTSPLPVARFAVRISGISYTQITSPSNSADKDAFLASYTADLASFLGVDASSISVVELRAGSVIVVTEVAPAMSTAAAAEALETQVSDALDDGTFSLPTVESSTPASLVEAGASISYSSAPVTAASSSSSDDFPVGNVVGGIFGGIAVIGIIVAIVVVVRKRQQFKKSTGGQRTHAGAGTNTAGAGAGSGARASPSQAAYAVGNSQAQDPTQPRTSTTSKRGASPTDQPSAKPHTVHVQAQPQAH